jgi:hypothetical protein
LANIRNEEERLRSLLAEDVKLFQQELIRAFGEATAQGFN